MHFMPNNNLAENISHFILNAPTKKFLASKNCISNSWNSKIAFEEPGSRFPKVLQPCPYPTLSLHITISPISVLTDGLTNMTITVCPTNPYHTG